MLRTGLIIAGAYLITALFVPPPFQGTDLARRVTGAPDGLVKMTYAARDGICGDGRSFIADATTSARGYDVWFSEGMSISTASMSDIGARCTRGPVRLLLVVRDHRVVDVQPFVGPSSPATERAGTELGTVSPSPTYRGTCSISRCTDATTSRATRFLPRASLTAFALRSRSRRWRGTSRCRRRCARAR